VKSDASMFPDGFVEETLQTLKLLFPKLDDSDIRWYRKRIPSSKANLDLKLAELECIHDDWRRAEKFMYWHDRLVMLKQEFDEARPESLRELWLDDRHGRHWYTLWIAVVVLILTLVFGLTQSIFEGMQLNKALHP
jgi:hypothetical protein